ncbi:TolC family protein [Chitinophaga flava]|uniref:TolC family protein n=1 Tax=Chitinophaga flava TaxID=2259036 RepID=A0A365XX84_9BACT|nr:TolC family protein [Chitinophaga flava]RBL90678.1 TolC family protein [Chitinophaga flava]
MKYYVLSLLLLAAMAYPRPSSGQPRSDSMTLADIWELAAIFNRQIKMQQQQLDGSTENVQAALDSRLPVIEVNGVYSRLSNMPLYTEGVMHAPTQFPITHEHYSAGSNLYLNLYNGGKTNREIAMARMGKMISQEQLHLTIAEIRYKTAVYFLELYRHQQFKSLLEQDIRASEHQLNEIRQLYKNGIVLKSDVLREEVKISNQQLSLTEAEDNISICTRKLNIMLGRPDGQHLCPLVEPPVNFSPAPDTSSSEAYEYKLALNHSNLGAIRLNQAKAAPLPTIGFFAEYNYSYPQTAYYPYSITPYSWGQTGVKIVVPVSSLYMNRHKTREAYIRLQQQQTAVADIQDNMQQEIQTAWLHYQEAIRQTAVARQNILHATESLRILRNSYFNQQSLLSDLLDAENQLLQSRFNLTTAQVKVQQQHYLILRLTGKI